MQTVKKIGNLVLNALFTTKGNSESDLEKHVGSHHMALHDAGTSDLSTMAYSPVIPATTYPTTMDKLDLPPSSSGVKAIMAISHGHQDELVSIGVVYAWMYKDEGFDEKVGGLVCGVGRRYRIEELRPRLTRVVSDPYQKTYGGYYLGELNFITRGITVEKRYGTVLAALCFVDSLQPEIEE